MYSTNNDLTGNNQKLPEARTEEKSSLGMEGDEGGSHEGRGRGICLVCVAFIQLWTVCLPQALDQTNTSVAR